MTQMRVADQSGHFLRVRAMMQAFGQDAPEAPTEPSEKIRILRARLMLEEVLETIEKGLGVLLVVHSSDSHDEAETWLPLYFSRISFETNGPFDIVETVDGCGDISVVTTGTLVACGVPDEPVLLAIDENNLEKVANGRVNPQTGKFEKHPDHRPPDIAGLIGELSKRAHDHVMSPEESRDALEAVRTGAAPYRASEAAQAAAYDAKSGPASRPDGQDGPEAVPAAPDAGEGRVGGGR